MIDELPSKVSIGPPATEVVELHVEKHEHVLSSTFRAEATCWAEDSMHWVAHDAESGTSIFVVVAGVDPEHVVSADNARTGKRCRDFKLFTSYVPLKDWFPQQLAYSYTRTIKYITYEGNEKVLRISGHKLLANNYFSREFIWC